MLWKHCKNVVDVALHYYIIKKLKKGIHLSIKSGTQSFWACWMLQNGNTAFMLLLVELGRFSY